MEIKLVKPSTLVLKGKSANLALQIGEAGQAKFTVEEVEIKGPGEYEVRGVQLHSFSCDGVTNYRIKVDGVTIAIILGSVDQKQEETLSDIDVLLIQGDKKFAELVLRLEPKMIVIYNTPEPGEFIRDIGKVDIAPTTKVVIKKESLPQELEAVWLT